MAALRLITSAAYVDPELVAEFGQIPPAFLPLGVSRLYEAQILRFGGGAPIHLTIPAGFSPPPYDQRRLAELGVTLVPVPEGLRLGDSIVFAINSIAASPGPVMILHGDTLIEDMPASSGDEIAVHDEGDDYSWAAVDLAGDRVTRLEVVAGGTAHESSRPVACGYFAFSDSLALVSAIARARGNFIAGINLYAETRAVQAKRVTGWRDFGHIQTYFRSRCAISTARSFNTLQVDPRTVRKSSTDRDKIRAEAGWFSALPAAVQPFSARLLEAGEDRDAAFYRTEYQYAPTLAELYVFSSIGRPTWRNILRSCQEFLAACAACKGPGSADAALADLSVKKTMERLECYARATGFDIDKPTRFQGHPMPSLRRIAEEMACSIDMRTGQAETLMHGDFCFSNILYNSRAGRIIVIDPRGYVQAGRPSIFGSTSYDLAKLSHSIVGCYDFILAGRYTLNQGDSHDFSIEFETDLLHDRLQRDLAELEVGGIRSGSRTVRGIVVGLFLSMLPLHADRPDRQAAFVANALRLYSDLERSRA